MLKVEKGRKNKSDQNVKANLMIRKRRKEEGEEARGRDEG